jgi:hypothetical protein
MRLPATLLQQIIGHPVSQFSGSGHQRALGRVELQRSATIFPIRDEIVGPSIFVSLRDISAETVAINSVIAMMPFSHLIVTIPLEEEQAVSFRCKVTRCTRVFGGQFAVVAQFLYRVDPVTLQHIPQP